MRSCGSSIIKYLSQWVTVREQRMGAFGGRGTKWAVRIVLQRTKKYLANGEF